MAFIKFHHKGSFKNSERFFNRVLNRNYLNILEKYGQAGVSVLQSATPTDTGKTRDSWDFGIEKSNGKITLYWTNSNTNNGANIALLLIYGHASQNGSYIEGINFVDPAIRPVFKQIAKESWEEVIR